MCCLFSRAWVQPWLLNYLAPTRDPSVTTFVSIGTGPGTSGDVRADSLENFKKIFGMNVLGIYGSEDTKRVKGNMKNHESIGKKIHGSRYQTIKIDGANHFYQGKQDVLVKIVSDWIGKFSAQ